MVVTSGLMVCWVFVVFGDYKKRIKGDFEGLLRLMSEKYKEQLKNHSKNADYLKRRFYMTEIDIVTNAKITARRVLF